MHLHKFTSVFVPECTPVCVHIYTCIKMCVCVRACVCSYVVPRGSEGSTCLRRGQSGGLDTQGKRYLLSCPGTQPVQGRCRGEGEGDREREEISFYPSVSSYDSSVIVIVCLFMKKLKRSVSARWTLDSRRYVASGDFFRDYIFCAS